MYHLWAFNENRDRLGPVHTNERIEDKCKQDEPEEKGVELLKARKMRRKPFNLRNNRSISFRRLYIHCQGSGAAGRNYRGEAASTPVGGSHSPRMPGPLTGTGSGPVIQGALAISGRIVGLSRREAERHGCSSIRGNHMNLGGPTATGLADGSVFFNAPVPSGCLDDGAVHGHRLDFNTHYLLSLQIFEDSVEHPVLGPPVHPGVNGVPVAKSGGNPRHLQPCSAT